MAMGALIVIVLAGGVIAGAIAQGKGLGFWGYFFLGCLLPIVAIIIAAVSKPNVGAILTPAEDVGWHRDPTGRFEQRYFDGRAWTRFVSRQGEQYEDLLSVR